MNDDHTVKWLQIVQIMNIKTSLIFDSLLWTYSIKTYISHKSMYDNNYSFQYNFKIIAIYIKITNKYIIVETIEVWKYVQYWCGNTKQTFTANRPAS